MAWAQGTFSVFDTHWAWMQIVIGEQVDTALSGQPREMGLVPYLEPARIAYSSLYPTTLLPPRLHAPAGTGWPVDWTVVVPYQTKPLKRSTWQTWPTSIWAEVGAVEIAIASLTGQTDLLSWLARATQPVDPPGPLVATAPDDRWRDRTIVRCRWNHRLTEWFYQTEDRRNPLHSAFQAGMRMVAAR